MGTSPLQVTSALTNLIPRLLQYEDLEGRVERDPQMAARLTTLKVSPWQEVQLQFHWLFCLDHSLTPLRRPPVQLVSLHPFIPPIFLCYITGQSGLVS